MTNMKKLKSIVWLAGKGNGSALYQLATFYKSGKVFKRDTFKAYVCFKLSGEKGNLDAKVALIKMGMSNLITDEMKSIQISMDLINKLKLFTPCELKG